MRRLFPVLILTACRAPVITNVSTHETMVSLDRAYISWFQTQASNAKTREELDRLAKIEQTWERWFGRVARLIALAENDAPDERKAAEIAIENELEQARRWLVSLGVFVKKQQGALKLEQRLGSSDLQSANKAFDRQEDCQF